MPLWGWEGIITKEQHRGLDCTGNHDLFKGCSSQTIHIYDTDSCVSDLSHNIKYRNENVLVRDITFLQLYI